MPGPANARVPATYAPSFFFEKFATRLKWRAVIADSFGLFFNNNFGECGVKSH